MDLKLFNTLGRKKMIFRPLKDKKVGLYTCGPTVYNFAHIGNLRTYIFEDILKRILVYNNYKVKHVMNITDVGHLSQEEGAAGQDRMLIALKREKKELSPDSLYQIADFYTKAFVKDIRRLNIQEPDIWAKATDHIKEIIELIKKIEKNGYTYETPLALYFNVRKFKNYSQLAGQELKEKFKNVRQGLITDPEKKHPADFALWFKLAGSHKTHILHWPSPWGEGFPGWHIECSAISLNYLGSHFDIHCGGIDHIPVHHTNEIAQNEAAFGHKTVNFWLHGAFLCLKEEKMAKSKGKFFTLEELIKKGISPLSYRYLILTAHYRQPLNFSWQSLDSAQRALFSLWQIISTFDPPSKVSSKFEEKFHQAINDDLNTSKALAICWKLIKSNLPSSVKSASLFAFDKVLGLKFEQIWQENKKIPKKILSLVQQRELLRKDKKFKQGDKIRKELEELGYIVQDTNKGPLLLRKYRGTVPGA